MNLVIHSEKALERGQRLCSVARERSVESAKVAVDVLALDAKVRWMTDAVLEQLKVCEESMEGWADCHTVAVSLRPAWRSS